MSEVHETFEDDGRACPRCGEVVSKRSLTKHQKTNKCAVESYVKKQRDRGLLPMARHYEYDMREAGVPIEYGSLRYKGPAWGSSRVDKGIWVPGWAYEFHFIVEGAVIDTKYRVPDLLRRAVNDEEFRAAMLAILPLCDRDPDRVGAAVVVMLERMGV